MPLRVIDNRLKYAKKVSKKGKPILRIHKPDVVVRFNYKLDSISSALSELGGDVKTMMRNNDLLPTHEGRRMQVGLIKNQMISLLVSVEKAAIQEEEIHSKFGSTTLHDRMRGVKGRAYAVVKKQSKILHGNGFVGAKFYDECVASAQRSVPYHMPGAKKTR